jgi:uncharacterized membrane protein YidH (DUF202 family)
MSPPIPPDAAADRPFDKGLQPERTALAWRRTSLSLAIGALVALRVLPHYWGVWGHITAGLGVILSIVILVLAQRRYHASHGRLTSGQHRDLGLPDGALPALLATTSLAAGLAALLLTVSIGGAH